MNRRVAADAHSDAVLSSAQRRHGRINAYAAQAVGIHLELILTSSAIGPLFIKKLGGNDLQAMLPATFISFLCLIQIPVAVMVHPHDGKRFLLRCWLASAGCMITGLAVSLVCQPSARVVWLVLGAILFMEFLICAGNTFWAPLLHDVVATEQRGRFFGNLRAGLNLIFFAVVMGAGIFLAESPPLWKFQLILGLATLFQILRNRFIACIPEKPSGTREMMSAAGDVKQILRRDVLAFCGYYAVLTFFAGFMRQPLVLFMKAIGFSTRENVMMFGMASLGSTAMLPFAGLLVDRLGTKRVFLGVHVILCFLALVVAVTAALPVGFTKGILFGVLILAGACFSSAELAGTAQIFHMAPEKGKALFMSLVTAMLLGGSLSPLVAGLILDSGLKNLEVAMLGISLNIHQLMFMFAGTGLLLSISLLHFVTDLRGKN